MAPAFAVLLVASLAGPLSGCSAESSYETETSNDELNDSALPTGTYVVDGKANLEVYVARLTLLSSRRYEADLVQGGETRLSRGTYSLFDARPNDPQSPVRTDKPWIALEAENGPSPNFEFDRLPNGGLKMYGPARHGSFMMMKDDNWRAPPAAGAKTISCTGNIASAKFVVDGADSRAATFDLIGEPESSSSRHPVPTATVSMTLVPVRETGVPDWVRYEGSRGGKDFSFGIKKDGFDRGTGTVQVSANWAEDGQQFDIGLIRCSF